MVRLTILCFALLLGMNTFYSQISDDDEIYFRKGLVRASATISPGRMLANKSNSIYISGFLEYLMVNNFTFRGDVFQYVDGKYTHNSIVEPKFMNRLCFGSAKYFGSGNWQNYFAAQAGLTTVKYPFSSIENRWGFLPTVSFKLGTSFYVWKYFHFFADVTYFGSRLRGTATGNVGFNDLVFSGGLGFQINTIRAKKN